MKNPAYVGQEVTLINSLMVHDDNVELNAGWYGEVIYADNEDIQVRFDFNETQTDTMWVGKYEMGNMFNEYKDYYPDEED